MNRILDSSIRIVRICPEHACKIFKSENLLSRAQSGEFEYKINLIKKDPPVIDRASQKLKIANEEHFGLDANFPPKHDRYIVFRAHCGRHEDGAIAASGKIDPKEMLVGNINYRQLKFINPKCEICEDWGEMISEDDRFFNSTYRPAPTTT